MNSDISALILAGGAGRRVGGADKGTLIWNGDSLMAHVHNRIAPQVQQLIISCNRNQDFYTRFSNEVIADKRADFQGPLAGLEAAESIITSPLILLAPCDTPQLPRDLAARLQSALSTTTGCELVYARSGNRDHYLCALMKTSALAGLGRFIDSGGRAVRHWYERCSAQPVHFEDPDAFININHLGD